MQLLLMFGHQGRRIAGSSGRCRLRLEYLLQVLLVGHLLLLLLQYLLLGGNQLLVGI